ncbi:conserved hypothetical protein [Pediculus humanus corporis]|uniref:Cortactin-binding protein-2 N-terminal domain-containing protein n=1 Tax=Pediculus humanus subsp. corporis TaxID=121224 RepID=E0VA72_PEDHC|nr:uncharacterized protein Phum_PHUM028720 [Pediculus humanus corporis]EEB10278.1 conserved hypothetical protein [Pediculus humanus corporis]
MELSKTDLLKLLSYLEGELQARDVVIATLKAEKVKRLLTPGRIWLNSLNDPRAALQRDEFASAEPGMDEEQIQSLAEFQMVALDNYVMQHRKMTAHMFRLKHEHDTAQGDDITYGLEKERTRLKQELELEKTGRKKAEKDLKRISDLLEEEKARTKSIVLLLIAERKKALIKYILAEEKSRIDAMAEGLEEESKKSLQMEAELEKQLAQYKDLEAEAERHKGEADNFKKQLVEAHHVAMFQAGTGTSGLCPRPPQPPAKPTINAPQPVSSPRPTAPTSGLTHISPKVPWTGSVAVTEGSASPPPNAMLSSVAKVVQPTATVSSVPVCGPISPGQGLRNLVYTPSGFSPAGTTTAARDPSWSSQGLPESSSSPQVAATGKATGVTPQVGAARVNMQPNAGGKVYGNVETCKISFYAGSNSSPTQPPLKKPATTGRGFPPPIPPNKPVVPPKKDVIRRVENEKGGSDQMGIKYNVNLRDKVHCPEVHEEESSRREPQETCS